MIDALIDAMIDSIKLIPFLFLTYLVMGILERAASEKSKHIISGAGKTGPLWGGILGAFPQCGFSAAASNFYAGRIITLGTLIAIYLSTSDEMLPIFISEKVPASTILKILGVKIIIGMVSGFLIDFLFGWLEKRRKNNTPAVKKDEEPCCHCGTSIIINAVAHTFKVFLFIFVVSLVINLVIGMVGEETLYNLFSNIPVLGQVVAALVGLIPNCAASVVITQLYLEGIIGAGPMMAGLLVSAGVGLLVLFEENRNLKENFTVLGLLYVLGVVWGILIDFLGITF